MNHITKASLIAAMSLLAAGPSANAALTFTLNNSINGAAPTSTAPWLTAVFENIVNNQNVTTGVKLTLTASLEVASEFISSVAFNVRPSIDPEDINVANNTPSNPQVTDVEMDDQNDQNLPGAGDKGKDFDIRIDWSTSNNSSGVRRFNATDVEQFTFTFNGLTEDDFNYTNPSGYHMAAHVQGIPKVGGGTTSGAIANTILAPTTAVPEPSTYVAAVLLALPVLSHVRRMRKAA
jgi:hypothetical protein